MGTPSSWFDPQNDLQNQQAGNGLPMDATQAPPQAPRSPQSAGNGLSPDNLPQAPASPSISSMMQPQTSVSPQIPQNNPQSDGGLKSGLQKIGNYGVQYLLHSFGLPTSQDLQDRQMRREQLQAEIDKTKTSVLQAHDQMSEVPLTDPSTGQVVTDPYGQPVMVRKMDLGKMMQQYLKNKGTAQVAQIGAGAKVQGAQISADSRENVAQMNNANKVPSKIGLVMRANAGDPDAKKALDYMHNQDLDLMKARGSAFGQGRLWSLQRAMDPETGESGFYTGFDILKNQQQGKNLIPMGALSAKDLISVQQLTSEAVPAIQGVKENLGAFDNTNDRAIFARVMKGMGGPTRGNEASWMGNVLDQALKEGLSPQGQQLAIKEQRLAETMGRLRSTLGLPATDQSMSVTLGLLPGPSTPNSKYAGDQIKQLGEMVDQATKVPIFGGAGNAPMHGAKPSTGTATFTDGGTTYNIPGNQIADFMRDHPKAVKR